MNPVKEREGGIGERDEVFTVVDFQREAYLDMGLVVEFINETGGEVYRAHIGEEDFEVTRIEDRKAVRVGNRRFKLLGGRRVPFFGDQRASRLAAVAMGLDLRKYASGCTGLVCVPWSRRYGVGQSNRVAERYGTSACDSGWTTYRTSLTVGGVVFSTAPAENGLDLVMGALVTVIDEDVLEQFRMGRRQQLLLVERCGEAERCFLISQVAGSEFSVTPVCSLPKGVDAFLIEWDDIMKQGVTALGCPGPKWVLDGWEKRDGRGKSRRKCSDKV